MTPSSIAGRLTLMFAIAVSLASALAGAGMITVQTIELKRHQTAELEARFEIVSGMIERAGDPVRWPILNEKLRAFTPADGRTRFHVESPDPRFRFTPGAPLTVKNGFGFYEAEGRRYMTLARTVPAFEQRPPVRLVIAADTAPFDVSRRVLAVGVVSLSILTTALISLLGWWIARRGLAPVGRLSERAAALNPDDLGLRMPLGRLPAELTGLMAAFNGALDRLQAAYERLSSFNADVAHELRTPVANLIGQTQVALNRPRCAEELEEVLHSNLEELERLRSIINDMLFMARADQGALAANLSPLSLAELTRKTEDFLDVLFDEAGMTLEVSGDGIVRADAALLGRAVTNLLDNAIRHGAGGPCIKVTIEDQGERICLGVRNRGAPISEAHLARLFDRFYRPDRARENSDEIHGLGLAVVKAIVTMHGGSVFARCEDGEVLIGFLLPAADRANATIKEAPKPVKAAPVQA